MRGKRIGEILVQRKLRITPAGAGKTNPVFNVDFAYRDHPRRCGENKYALLLPSASAGSPPQVRGKLTYIF